MSAWENDIEKRINNLEKEFENHKKQRKQDIVDVKGDYALQKVVNDLTSINSNRIDELEQKVLGNSRKFASIREEQLNLESVLMEYDRRLIGHYQMIEAIRRKLEVEFDDWKFGGGTDKDER